jgi:polysaccharide export outer membrane protein
MRKAIICTILLLAMASSAPTGFLSAQTAASKPPGAATNEPDKNFVIGLEDLLSINVWREPELSQKEVVVRPDGKIGIPLVGDIQANGLTTLQLQDKITEKLREFVASPVVTVSVVRILSTSVSIVGQVTKPGVYPLGAPMTVLELLARAGGVTLDAKSKKIKVLRKDGVKMLQFDFNYNDAVQGKNLQKNILLKTGDVVVVP